MISLHDDISTQTNETPPKIPRLNSLLHRLQHAKDPDGQPLDLLDELLFFLDDPPTGTGDRWQKGAELCQAHGIQTTRMSVWRLYRSHILQWRREQIPPAPPPTAEETARLHDQARHLAAQRALEALNDPRLSPGHLIGLIQNDNHRRQVQLATDQFNDRLAVRRRLEQQKYFQRIDHEIRDQCLFKAQLKSIGQYFAILHDVSPHNTP